MDIRILVGSIAATRALYSGWRQQGEDFARIGLVPLAAAWQISGEFLFAPIIAWQNNMARYIQDSAMA